MLAYCTLSIIVRSQTAVSTSRDLVCFAVTGAHTLLALSAVPKLSLQNFAALRDANASAQAFEAAAAQSIISLKESGGCTRREWGLAAAAVPVNFIFMCETQPP